MTIPHAGRTGRGARRAPDRIGQGRPSAARHRRLGRLPGRGRLGHGGPSPQRDLRPARPLRPESRGVCPDEALAAGGGDEEQPARHPRRSDVADAVVAAPATSRRRRARRLRRRLGLLRGRNQFHAQVRRRLCGRSRDDDALRRRRRAGRARARRLRQEARRRVSGIGPARLGLGRNRTRKRTTRSTRKCSRFDKDLPKKLRDKRAMAAVELLAATRDPAYDAAFKQSSELAGKASALPGPARRRLRLRPPARRPGRSGAEEAGGASASRPTPITPSSSAARTPTTSSPAIAPTCR